MQAPGAVQTLPHPEASSACRRPSSAGSVMTLAEILNKAGASSSVLQSQREWCQNNHQQCLLRGDLAKCCFNHSAAHQARPEETQPCAKPGVFPLFPVGDRARLPGLENK